MRERKNRKINFSFVPLPREVCKSDEYAMLKSSAVKLLVDLYVQYNGKNNGDLALTWSIMSKHGWRSKATLERAKKELLKAGFIEETRKGGRHCCSLFAVPWIEINCDRSKLDARKSYAAKNAWKNKEPATKTSFKCNQNGGKDDNINKN